MVNSIFAEGGHEGRTNTVGASLGKAKTAGYPALSVCRFMGRGELWAVRATKVYPRIPERLPAGTRP